MFDPSSPRPFISIIFTIIAFSSLPLSSSIPFIVLHGIFFIFYFFFQLLSIILFFHIVFHCDIKMVNVMGFFFFLVWQESEISAPIEESNILPRSSASGPSLKDIACTILNELHRYPHYF